MNIVGLVGFADSGKGTASKVLVERDYVPIAFADALKDMLAAVFGWPRKLLEGDTDESRAWRERVDPWWAEKLGIPHFTPRWAMQNIGTEVMRRHFHDGLWVLRVEKTLYDLQRGAKPNAVLTDIRFPNEGAVVRNRGGLLIRIKRGPEPEWFEVAVAAAKGSPTAIDAMRDLYGVHESEWRWLALDFDFVVENDGTVDDLRQRIAGLIR